MSASDPQALVQWREASLWLARAQADIVGARTLVVAGQAELAAFHVQQALEKTLKALLVAAAQDLRRIHDVEALATLARSHWPDLLPSPFPLAAVSQWYVTTRYPGLEAAPPAIAEVAEALEAVTNLIAAVVRFSPPGAAAEHGQCEA